MPKFFAESPVLLPSHFDEYVERRRSVHNEYDAFGIRKATEDTELERVQRFRSDSISPFDLDIDKDGFRKPKDFRNDGYQDQFPRRESIDALNLQFPSLPTVSVPEEKARRPIIPLNPGFASAFGNQFLSPGPLVPYSPESMRYSAFMAPSERPRKNSGVQMSDYFGGCASPGPIQSPLMQASPGYSNAMSADVFAPKAADSFRLDAEAREEELMVRAECAVQKLTDAERREKIQKYLKKRENRIWRKKISYDCRKKVADKRLRIKGRFVTKQQAFAVLGATPEELAKNKLLQDLITSNDNCSIVTSTQNVKIRNIQTLLNNPGKPRQSKGEGEDKKEEVNERANEPKGSESVKVKILKKNAQEHTVEIKIETLGKTQVEPVANPSPNQRERTRLPKLQNSVFHFKKLKLEDCNPSHAKYHKE
eukprot:TRINITY_DN11818_c0_g1_i26.p1 TRINITY_DN11818_c0_g1~~TRINITY_DN11818_c0_g1_i26.p1  ORF type:complete len:423 (+),score=101.30 TRINITY_DN11818_c0_g1_i26:230-1498(+)